MLYERVYVLRIFQYLVLLCLLSACSSIISRVGEKSQIGKPYVGLKHSTWNAAECSFAALLSFPPAVLVTIPLGIVDIMGSAILDTILLPLDLAIEESDTTKQGICHIDWSK